MRLRFWGTRGSLPTFNSDTQVYGGNTSCLSVENEGELIILDAGSGIKPLADSELVKSIREFHILITHMHFDHIQGLGFFTPFFNSECRVNIYGPASNSEELFKILTKYLSPPLFPVRIRDFKADLQFHALPRRSLRTSHLSINASFVCHPGPTLGFRISDDTHSFCYIPDHEVALGVPAFPKSAEWTSGYELAAGCDVLIHDAQYDTEQYPAKTGWGHSTYDQAIKFAELCKVRQLYLFHHDPMHSDLKLEEMLARHKDEARNTTVSLAREGDCIDLPV
ncbi:MAG TPA: MBL fold metallo-hydrolase [Saprospiraceae bacterium]|nr:MBL fold metallo-hydrolase [Saprospiraceae bacterium]HNT19317.1 MBL fold metallo-hydrolase [Saprospiraceae bacterium]